MIHACELPHAVPDQLLTRAVHVQAIPEETELEAAVDTPCRAVTASETAEESGDDEAGADGDDEAALSGTELQLLSSARAQESVSMHAAPSAGAPAAEGPNTDAAPEMTTKVCGVWVPPLTVGLTSPVTHCLQC